MVNLFQPSKLWVIMGKAMVAIMGTPISGFFLTVPLVQNPIFLGVLDVFGVQQIPATPFPRYDFAKVWACMRPCCRWSIRLAGNWQVLMHWCTDAYHCSPLMKPPALEYTQHGSEMQKFPRCHWRKKWSPSAKRQLPFQPPIFFLALWNVNVVRRHDMYIYIYDIEVSKKSCQNRD